MIIDKLLSPAILLPLSGLSVATATLGGVMDFGVARNNGLLANTYGPGWDINVVGATSGGAATARLLLVTDDNKALSSPTTLWDSGVVTLANFANYRQLVPPPSNDLWERWVAWRITVGTAVFTGGTLSIQFAANKRNWRDYPSQGNR